MPVYTKPMTTIDSKTNNVTIGLKMVQYTTGTFNKFNLYRAFAFVGNGGDGPAFFVPPNPVLIPTVITIEISFEHSLVTYKEI